MFIYYVHRSMYIDYIIDNNFELQMLERSDAAVDMSFLNIDMTAVLLFVPWKDRGPKYQTKQLTFF